MTDMETFYKEGLKEVEPKLIGPENFSLWKNNLFMEIHYEHPYVWKLVNEGDEAVKKEVKDFEKVKKEADEILDARVKSVLTSPSRTRSLSKTPGSPQTTFRRRSTRGSAMLRPRTEPRR